jgi:hypothetical protein
MAATDPLHSTVKQKKFHVRGTAADDGSDVMMVVPR